MSRHTMAAALCAASLGAGCGSAQRAEPPVTIQLPAPKLRGAVSVEEALQKRRSVRGYQNEALTLSEISQLLWAAQGTTNEAGRRTAPSAGGLYPLELYVVAGNVKDLEPGIYKYASRGHTLAKVASGDKRSDLAAAALGQQQVARGAVCLVIAGVYERTAKRYKERAVRYVHMEAGHAAQNIYLQAAPLGLGTVVLGAFEDARVKSLLGLPEEENPLYIMPVGRPAGP